MAQQRRPMLDATQGLAQNHGSSLKDDPCILFAIKGLRFTHRTPSVHSSGKPDSRISRLPATSKLAAFLSPLPGHTLQCGGSRHKEVFRGLRELYPVLGVDQKAAIDRRTVYADHLVLAPAGERNVKGSGFARNKPDVTGHHWMIPSSGKAIHYRNIYQPSLGFTWYEPHTWREESTGSHYLQ